MRLRKVDYGRVIGGSGVQGFFGEPYAYHRWARKLGLDFTGMGFVAKTTTLEARKGNMELAPDGITPVRFLPDCIHVSPRSWLMGCALNAVGLSGPGAEALLNDGRWQARTEPFMLSFMSVKPTKRERVDELRGFVQLLGPRLGEFNAPVALQINFSCPNVGLDIGHLLGEIHEALMIAAELDIALVPKLAVTAPPEIAHELSGSLLCDAIYVSNTIKWGTFPDEINWRRIFGTDESPLAKYGGGGGSGKLLFKLVVDWVRMARIMGATVPINAGGGILTPGNAKHLLRNGADSVYISSMAFLRPWRVQPTIRAAQRCQAFRPPHRVGFDATSHS